jgi:hypothetical protein
VTVSTPHFDVDAHCRTITDHGYEESHPTLCSSDGGVAIVLLTWKNIHRKVCAGSKRPRRLSPSLRQFNFTPRLKFPLEDNLKFARLLSLVQSALSLPPTTYFSSLTITDISTSLSIAAERDSRPSIMTDAGLVIGVDYGTTYSGARSSLKVMEQITDKSVGIAFCETSGTDSREEHVEVIHDWPSYHTKIGTKEKVPSEIAYTTEGVRWGSLIRSNIARHMWTKLRLEGSQVGESAKIQRELEMVVEGSDKTPIEIAADFLHELKGHLVANLDQKYGTQLWRTLPITLVVTVPAVWSDAAKDRTLQAFQKAGFNPREFPLLHKQMLTTEPEAAAIYTIKTMRGTAQDRNLSVGDGFMVCDMGGGTVDLISYRVASLQPTMISEATVGSGAQCGGTFIDREFLKWLEHRLGTTDFVKIAGCRSGDVPRTSLAKKAAQMLQDFTLEAKTCFSGDEPYYLRLPAPLSGIEEDESRGIYDGELQLTP